VSNDFRRIVTLAVGLPLDASDDEIATKLGELLGAKQSARAVSEGAKKFDELVGEAMATHKLSYGAAASKVSMERPDLYHTHREAAYLN